MNKPELQRPSSYHDSVPCGSRSVPFTVERRDRRTLGISVLPSGSVEVRAPFELSAETVRQQVGQRVDWILRQQRRFVELERNDSVKGEKEYVSGESHYYLGGRYRLKIESVDTSSEEGVTLVGRFIHVRVVDPGSAEHVRRLLRAWYRMRAEERLRERFSLAGERMSVYGVSVPPMTIRRMRLRWGSCSGNGRITLNPELILAPVHCIDYVILHEFCHLVYPYHNRLFYRLLETVVPDWKRLRDRLGSVATEGMP